MLIPALSHHTLHLTNARTLMATASFASTAPLAVLPQTVWRTIYSNVRPTCPCSPRTQELNVDSKTRCFERGESSGKFHHRQLKIKSMQGSYPTRTLVVSTPSPPLPLRSISLLPTITLREMVLLVVLLHLAFATGITRLHRP